VRIVLVTRRFPPLIGGAEKMLSYLSDALAAEGAAVTVLTARAPDTAAEEERAGGVRVVRLPTSGLRFVGTWRYMRALRQWLERNAVDVAYVSMLKHDAFVAVEVGRRKGLPVVLRPEGAGATGDLAWQSWGRFGLRIGRRCRSADAVIAISPAIRAELLAHGYDRSRIHDLPNGVPVPAEPWQPRADWSRSPRAVFVGRLAPEKGLDVLVEAWAKVRAVRPLAKLVVVGEGSERARLTSQVERLRLTDAVDWAGAVADATGQLRGADVFVLPSREEGMSIALLEAMGLGLPVVASAIPGNQRLITDGEHGRLVTPDDPDALARAILATWEDPRDALDRGERARRRVVEEYSIAAVARRHMELFERLISAV
jgi:glycosyltransferase involved in cell wall biosynthesis